MRHLVILVFVIASIDSFSYDSLSRKLMSLEKYVNNLKPIHVIGTDTFSIPKLSMPPDSINQFLYLCKKKKIEEAYKYAFLAVLKLKLDYGKYDYDFCYYYKNGIIDLVLSAMNMEHEYLSVDCAFVTTDTVYIWLEDNKQIYYRYRPIKKYMRKIKKVRKIND